MKRNDTEVRYRAFLNEWLDYVQVDLPITLKELNSKYGISGSFATYVQKQGLFKNESISKRNPVWSSSKKEAFTEKEVISLINGFNAFKKSKKIEKEKPPQVLNGNEKVHECELAKVATEDLIKELRKRGYSGELHHITKIKI